MESLTSRYIKYALNEVKFDPYTAPEDLKIDAEIVQNGKNVQICAQTHVFTYFQAKNGKNWVCGSKVPIEKIFEVEDANFQALDTDFSKIEKFGANGQFLIFAQNNVFEIFQISAQGEDVSCEKICASEAPGPIKFVSILAKTAFFVLEMAADSDQIFAFDIENFKNANFDPVEVSGEKMVVTQVVGNNNFIVILSSKGHILTLTNSKLKKMPKRENIALIDCHSGHFLAL